MTQMYTVFWEKKVNQIINDKFNPVFFQKYVPGFVEKRKV